MKKSIIIGIVIVVIVAALLYFTSGSKTNEETKKGITGGTGLNVSAWYKNYSSAMISSLNQWIKNYTSKWHPGDPQAQKDAAVYQLWEQYRKSGKTEFPTVGIDLNDFSGYGAFQNFLISEGIIAQLKTY